MSPVTILLYVLGIALIAAGIAVIVLTYATKVFHTKVTSIKAGASDPGLDLYRSAFIVWDEQNQTFDSNGKLTAWNSNSTYADTVGGAQYAYLLRPRPRREMSFRTSNSGTKGIVPSTSVAFNNEELITNQALASFPQSNSTIIMVGSGPVTEIPANSVTNGMSVRYGNLSMGVSFNFNSLNYSTAPGNVVFLYGPTTAIQPIQTPATFKTYTTSTSQTYSANTVGITYTTSTDKTLKLYMNGQKVTFNTDRYKLTDDKLTAPIVFATPPRFQVGASDIYASSTSAYYAILVFNRILNDAEMITLDEYLKKKYFAPKLTYPTTVTLKTNEALSAPIANTLVSGADPILSYSISPALPSGLVFNTTSGNISGAATVSSAARDYTITATNAIMSNTCVMNLTVPGATATTTTGSTTNTSINKEAVPAPNISIPEKQFTFPLNTNVSTTAPINTGGTIANYTIDPANITQTTGLQFDATKGILSGTATRSAILNVTITALNNETTGRSAIMFMLVTGQNIVYPTPSVQTTVGNAIQNIPVAISNGSGVIIAFSSEGDLLGLTLDSNTGVISGTPTSAGKSTVTIYAKTPDNSVFASTTITFDIQPSEELKNKSTYLAVGGAVAGIGAITLGVAGYLTYSKTYSNKLNTDVAPVVPVAQQSP